MEGWHRSDQKQKTGAASSAGADHIGWLVALRELALHRQQCPIYELRERSEVPRPAAHSEREGCMEIRESNRQAVVQSLDRWRGEGRLAEGGKPSCVVPLRGCTAFEDTPDAQNILAQSRNNVMQAM